MSRIELPVLRAQQVVDCTECGRCCTYVGIDINAPTSVHYATDVLWYLYHQGVYVYLDGAGEWSVHFETRCRNLGDDLLCRIYAERPHICRGFDNRSCEVNARNDASRTFREPAEFLAWLRERRPKLYAKIERGFVPKALRPRRPEPAERTRVPRVAKQARGGSGDRPSPRPSARKKP